MRGLPLKSYSGAQAAVALAAEGEKFHLYGFTFNNGASAATGSVVGKNGTFYFACAANDMANESFQEPVELTGPVTVTTDNGNLTLVGKVLKEISGKTGVA